MPLFQKYNNSTNSSESANSQTPSKENSILGIVKQVYYDYSQDSNGFTIIPGTIKVEMKGKNYYADRPVYPLDEFFTSLPLMNELVEVIILSTVPYYRRYNFKNTLNNSFLDKVFQSGVASKPTPEVSLDNFKTQYVTKNQVSSTKTKLGENFKVINSNRLRLNEGDTIIQSRFGQSIRLSGYLNDTNDLVSNNQQPKSPNPTITIRNGESIETLTNNSNNPITVLEDINKDGSTIQISSGKFKSPFIPGKTKPGGKSNFKIRPSGVSNKYAFEGYPKVLDGDQILITSDRLIFSSRANEMIFWSKGNFGVITDSLYSIDSLKGVNIVTKEGGIDLQCENQQINLNVGKSGNINLGIGDGNELSGVPNSTALEGVLHKMLDAIANLGLGGINTGAGPSLSLSPQVLAQITQLHQEVKNIASKKVFVAK